VLCLLQDFVPVTPIFCSREPRVPLAISFSLCSGHWPLPIFFRRPDFSSPCLRQVSGFESQALISNAGLCSVINFAGSSSLTACSVCLLLFFSPTEVHSGQQQGFDFIFRESPGLIYCQFGFLCSGAPCAAVGFVDFVPAAWI
jgi:hypothetical protein